jgi:hypothetical protein
MKINNKVFAVVAGLLLLLAAAFIWWQGFPDAGKENSHYILLSQIVLVGLALTVVFMGGWPNLSHGIPNLGLPHPSRVFFAGGWASAPTTICMNARQTSPLSKPAKPAFHHV